MKELTKITLDYRYEYIQDLPVKYIAMVLEKVMMDKGEHFRFPKVKDILDSLSQANVDGYFEMIHYEPDTTTLFFYED